VNVEEYLAKLNRSRSESHFSHFQLQRLTATHHDLETDPFNYVVPYWRFPENDTYRVAIDWKVFLLAGRLTFTFVLLTITFRTLKTVLINPAETLKYE
jgi:hypothetical protein